MRHRSWKLWVAGIALVQLLVAGVEVALLWPTPSEAEVSATAIHPGMTIKQVRVLIDDPNGIHDYGLGRGKLTYCFPDGSELHVFGAALGSRDFRDRIVISFGAALASRDFLDGIVISTAFSPPDPVPPLTRLRRTLARAFPFLAE